jgi:hypothetical protein
MYFWTENKRSGICTAYIQHIVQNLLPLDVSRDRKYKFQKRRNST